MEQAWQDFGQKVDLTARLREILINYPEGTSILKEIVQNADDAKASTVKFCLDHNTYPSGSVLSAQMAQFQGPALLSYNDGVFSEKDFESISRVGDSKKREQIGKTGRFGVGFNAIYHLTDVPSFASGQHLVVFDPHCKHLPAVSSANPGKKINFVEHDLRSTLADQVAPYQQFGCNTRSFFAGTLFRFPLRTQEQADASSISKQVYTTDKIAALLSDLQQEAHLILLFLKSIRSIEVLELHPGQQEPQLLFSCSIANATAQLLQQRALFLRASSAPAQEEVSGTYKLELLSRDAASGASKSTAFLISQKRGSTQLLTMAQELSRQFQVPLVAWGAVAAEISSSNTCPASSAAVAAGRAFCFLPLPASTGLPVHINGYFELSSNRRDVWHGSDMAGAGRLRAQWNEALVQLVVAPAYVDLLTAAAKVLGHGAEYARLWPVCDAPEPWQGVVRQLYGNLAEKPLLWTAAGGGRWLPIGQCIFPDAACLQEQPFHLLTAAEAKRQRQQHVTDQSLQQQLARGSSTDSAATGLGPLGQALLLFDVPLLDMPAAVLNMMQKHLPELPHSCTPAAARSAVAAHGDRATILQREAQLVPLLAYCLADIDLAVGPEACQQLLKLRLLPLSDGLLAEITAYAASSRHHQQQQLVFVVTEELELALVSSQRNLLLDHDLVGPAITAKLSLAASYACLNLQPLTVQHLVSIFLPQFMPARWRNASAVEWKSEDCNSNTSGASSSPITWEWLQSFWQWMGTKRQDFSVLISTTWPLLPVLGNQLVPLKPLSASAVVAPSVESWPDGLAAVLMQLGCFVLDTASFELPLDQLMTDCVHKPSGPGIAAAICASLGWRAGNDGQVDSQQLRERAGEISQRLSVSDCRLLRSFLLQQRWFNGTGRDTVKPLLLVLRHLPLYELANRSSAARDHAQLQREEQQQQGLQAAPAEEENVLVALEPGCCLAPAGVYTSALDNRFLKAANDQEAAFLVQQLGVAAPTAAKVYTDVIFPQLETFPEAVRDAAMLCMLRGLSELQQQDRSFARVVSKVAFVPNSLGQLQTPSRLYDPRSPELVALLDPEACFPAPHFCGDFGDDPADGPGEVATTTLPSDSAHGFSCLAALQQLGLRSSADLETLVLAARYVEKTAKEGDVDMAIARGKALLSYLDTEAERLVGRHTAITSAAAAAIASATTQATSSDSSRRPSNSSSDNETYEDGSQRKRKQRPGFLSAMKSLWGLGGRGHLDEQQQQQIGKTSQLFALRSGADDGGSGLPGQLESAEQQQTAARELSAAHWAELARTCWCPVLAASPEPALPWKGDSALVDQARVAAGREQPSTQLRLAAPRAARPRGDLWLVSSVMDVVDGNCRSPVLLTGLGWSEPLPGAVLAAQLSAVGTLHRHVRDASLAQQLARVVPVLYAALSGLSQDELAAAAAVLEGQPTVWVGNGFVQAARVAFKGGLDLSPHLYVLPLELSPFRELMAILGAQEAFSAAQYTTLLQDMGRDAAGKPLAPQQLAQALAVVQALADVVGASGGGATAGKQVAAAGGKQQEVLLVPDDKGVLRPAAELAYDDAPWLETAAAGLDSELHLVHPRVSAPVAEALGVASRRRLMLAASADCLSLGLAGAGGAVEAFGQSEALTTRLRHIIQDYPEGPGVLLELVQNADDAGASKAAFLLDARQHGTASLLGPGMAAWQGPALVAYNDATFSPGDFAAIARIGQDGKMAQPAAIGRFGLGFNAVYHLTDLPSFVSGQHLVLFDPHAKYLPGASAAQPGLRVNLNRGGGRLIQQFPDAFAPYMHFGCTMEGSYPGTLFRFPLRGATTAATSDIKSSPTTAAQALQLLQSLADVLPEALLFLKSLKQIEVYVLGDVCKIESDAHGRAGLDEARSGEQERPRLLFRANLTAVDGGEPLQQPILNFVSSGGGGSGAQQLDAFYRRLSTTPEQELPSSIGRVQLTMTVPSPPSPAAAAGAAALVTGSDAATVEVLQQQWLVCNQLGGGDARALALKAWRDDQVKMVPWVGVAARLSHFGDSEGCSSAGRAFCFLPLPASTGLPVHINGYFELSSNRRDVWHGSDMAGAGRLRAQWNEALLAAAVAPAYAALLLEAGQLLGPSPDFWQLLPGGQGTVPEPWLKVAASVYKKLASKALLWSPVAQGSWLTPQQALLPDAACFNRVTSTAVVPAAPSGFLGGSDNAGGAAGIRCPSNNDSTEAAIVSMGHVGRMEGASVLSELLVGCRVPLVVGVTEEQQLCLMQWTPGTQQISPALARRLLASNANHLSQFLPRQRHQHHLGQHPAAVLLQYCLSDASITCINSSSTNTSNSKTQAAQNFAANANTRAADELPTQLLGAVKQLNGLPLLPAADGSLQAIRVDAQQPQSSSSSRGSSKDVAERNRRVIYVPARAEECKLLNSLPGQLLHPTVGLELQQQLLQVAAAGVSNIKLITCKNLDEDILPQLLPFAWRNQAEVVWQKQENSSGTSAEVARLQGTEGSDITGNQQAIATIGDASGHDEPAHPQAAELPAPGAGPLLEAGRESVPYPATSREFVQLLWQWMADRSDADDLVHWPVLPVSGGKLRLLQQPAQVLQVGDWTEQLTSALCKLGCCLLDSSLVSPICPALAPFVQQPTAVGLLDALAAVQAVHAAAEAQRRLTVQHHGTTALLPLPGSGGKSFQQMLQGLTAAERHHLRTYLLQQKWFTGQNTGLTKHHLQQLSGLPIFEVYPSLTYENGEAPQQQGSTAAAAAVGAVPAHHMPLALPGQPPQLLLPPDGISSQVLGSKFLRCESHTEAELLMQYLDVRRLPLTRFLSEHFAVAPQQLDQRGVVSSVVYVLHNLQQLAQVEPSLPSVLGGLPIIPTRASATTGQLQLAAPSSLFDPRNADLRQLLDPLKHFPAAPFDGSSSDAVAGPGAAAAAAMATGTWDGPGLLESLVLCGLKTEIDLEVLVTAAESIAAYAPDDPAPHKRAEVLLQQLDKWAQHHQQPTGHEEALLRVLRGTPWCPVLLEPPSPGLPWPHGSPRTLQRVANQNPAHATAGGASLSSTAGVSSVSGSNSGADSSSCGSAADGSGLIPGRDVESVMPVLRIAPKLVAPAEMAWLVSAPLRLLAGPYVPSKHLQQLLEWSAQQVLRPSVAIAQIMELGKMYPAGAVQDTALQAQIEKAAGVLYSSLSAMETDQHQLLEMTLSVTPSVWVGSGFAYPAITAFHPFSTNSIHAAAASSMDEAAPDQVRLQQHVGSADQAESSSCLQQQILLQEQQLLWVVSPALLQQHPAAQDTLLAIGVQQHFDFAAYAIALAVLAERAAGQLLDSQQLSLALLLADAAAQALSSGTGSVQQLQQPSVMQAATALQAEAAAAAGSSCVSAAGGADVLLLPDVHGVMAQPGELYFNDAAWLEVEGLRFAHQGLSQATCEALGVRSMRYQHEVNTQLTTNISCPSMQEAAAAAATVFAACSAQNAPASSSNSIPAPAGSGTTDSTDAAPGTAANAAQAVLGTGNTGTAGPVTAALLAVLAWADQMRQGVHGQHLSVRVVLDERQHGRESLLHPGLAKLQGPSLCVSIEGLSLSATQLQHLQLGRSKGLAHRAEAAGGGIAVDPAAAAHLGLASVWAVTDVCQVMSGDTTCYWDPSGAALAQSAAELRTPAPRGRSVRHAQPGLARRFADQWDVWQPCSMQFSSAAAAAGAEAAAPGADVSGAVYIRLPLRLQDQGLHGGGLAAAAGELLGQGGRALGLRLEDVRRQVAVYGAAATRSLLFLGCVQRVSVVHWPAAAESVPVQIWQGCVLPDGSGGMPLRVGRLAARLQHEAGKHAPGGGGVLQALLARGGSKRTSYKNCWPISLQVMSRCCVLVADREEGATDTAHQLAECDRQSLQQLPLASSTGGTSSSADTTGNAMSAACEPDDKQQHHHSSAARIGSTGPPEGEFTRQELTFMVSAVCEALPEGTHTGAYATVDPYSAQGVSAALSTAAGAAGLQQLVPRSSSSSSSDGAKHSEGSRQPVFVTSAVAVCIKQGSGAAPSQVTPTAGMCSAVAVPCSNACCISRQNFLVNMHSEPPVALPVGPREQDLSLRTAAAAAAGGGLASSQQQQHFCSAVQHLMLARVVTAWQELVDMLNTMRLPGLYCLLPDLAGAIAAGDTDAASAFKSMLQGVASLPIWQLHSGRLAHLQEGAFLPPRESPSSSSSTAQQQEPQQQLGQAGSGADHTRHQPHHSSGVVTGLGLEARQFITRHLPLFKVPWSVVAQLEAAGIAGLRVVSPNVLRPLLCRLGVQPLAAGERHPFHELTPVQALQLLEFCCSDLMIVDSGKAGRGAAGSSTSTPTATAAAAAAAGSHPFQSGSIAATAAASSNAGLGNLPDGAAALVGEVLGPRGLTVLRGLANQVQAQVTRGIDDVLNAVLEAMNDAGPAAGNQQQLQQGDPAAAAAVGRGTAVAAAGSNSSNQQQPGSVSGAPSAQPQTPTLDLNRVKWLRGLPVPTAAGTVAVLGSCALFVYPDTCQPVPQSLLPSHLLKQFVSTECVSALAWALKHAALRQELNLAYYGFKHMAVHLKDVLGQTWDLSSVAAVSSSSHSMGGGSMAGRYGAPAAAAVKDAPAAAVPWNDGTAGGPYYDWLQRLWQVMLHIIAAALAWQVDTTWSDTVAATAGAASESGFGMNVGQRARQMLVNADAAAAAAAQLIGTGSFRAFGSPVANPAAGSAEDDDGAPSAADLMWQPLAEWPLLPLADGRLLKLEHRELVLAVLPEYTVAGSQGTSPEAWADNLKEPWSWLLPAAVAAGIPLLDPRFNTIIATAPTSTVGAAASAAGGAAAASTQVSSNTTAASASEHGAVHQAASLPVEQLLGPQPVIGRPPFLGPLLRKLQGAQQQQLGNLLSPSTWEEATWEKLFTLLADHPPRDLKPGEVGFLRVLPMYKRLQVVPVVPGAEEMQQMHEDYERVVDMIGRLQPGGDLDAPEALPNLVALGDQTQWVLAPESLVRSCAAILALPSLPKSALRHLLEHRTNWGELYHIAGLEPTNMAGLLKDLLLPYLLQLTPADRKAALNFIVHTWSATADANLSRDQEFVQALSAIAFVPARMPDVAPATAAGAAAAARAARTVNSGTRSGSSEASSVADRPHEHTEQLYLADQLFDPTVPLFAKVMDIFGMDVRFPAAPYDNGNWLQVLRALGLQSQVTAETCLQLAKHLAASAAALAAAAPGNCSSSSNSANEPAPTDGAGYTDLSAADAALVERLVSAADALLTTLRGKSSGASPRAFWQELGKVQFVPATVGLPGSRASRLVFTSCANAAQHKDWHLVWSVMPVLSDGRSLPTVLAQLVGMRSPPPLSAVLQHLSTVGADGGEDLLASWPDGVESMSDLTLKVLEHLDREGLSKNQAQQLSSAAFIPVAHCSRLVAPQQLFMRLSGAALAPFVWEVPGQYVSKAQLLQQLGVKEEPRAEDLVQALQRFELQLAGRRMNPNELAASLRLLAFLSSRSSARDASFLANARRSSAALLVPTAGALLMPASRVVHVGLAGGSVAAARLLGRADPQHLVLAHPQLSDHICRWLGVASLSDMLSEELDPAETLVPVPAINGTSLQHLQQLLGSPHFAASVFSIAAAHAAAVPALRQMSLGGVSQVCAAAAAAGKLVLVEKLASRVVLRGSGRDVTRDTASRQVYEFYDSSTGTMYVAIPPPGLTLSSLLAQVLSRALGSPFTLPLHPLLDVPDAQTLPGLQSVLHSGGYDQELEGALASGHVGSPVQPADRTLLRLRPLRHYSAGEVVAVKRRSNTATAAAATGKETPGAGAAAGSSSSGHVPAEVGDAGDGAVLCYARVAVDAAPAPGQAAYRLSVEVEPGVYDTLLSTQVFCFQSGAFGTGAVAAHSSAAAAAPTGRGGPNNPAGQGAASSSSMASSSSNADTTAGQQMAASELASAVADMLNAAGMPLDLDRQQLLQKALVTDQQLSKATAAIAELRQEAQQKEQELDALRNSWQCRVCFSRDVNQAFVGCGHMYCSSCMPSLAKCPVCRTSSAKIKLYR